MPACSVLSVAPCLLCKPNSVTEQSVTAMVNKARGFEALPITCCPVLPMHATREGKPQAQKYRAAAGPNHQPGAHLRLARQAEGGPRGAQARAHRAAPRKEDSQDLRTHGGGAWQGPRCARQREEGWGGGRGGDRCAGGGALEAANAAAAGAACSAGAAAGVSSDSSSASRHCRSAVKHPGSQLGECAGWVGNHHLQSVAINFCLPFSGHTPAHAHAHAHAKHAQSHKYTDTHANACKHETEGHTCCILPTHVRACLLCIRAWEMRASVAGGPACCRTSP